MTPRDSRIFLFLDEWFGIALAVYLWIRVGWPLELLLALVLSGLVLFVYIIGYATQWRLEKQERRCRYRAIHKPHEGARCVLPDGHAHAHEIGVP